MLSKRITVSFGCILIAIAHGETAAQDEPPPRRNPMLTRWAADVNVDAPLPEYPRPQLVRERWQNLNGIWDFELLDLDERKPVRYEDRILVPFPIESTLSGVCKPVTFDARAWYRNYFRLPPDWRDQRILLHFGAVDWHAEVWVNDVLVGEHRGGYDPFSFDITDALEPFGRQELIVAVTDPTETGEQPRGKQVLNPGGIWYTAVSGIWQTVWVEPVPPTSIDTLTLAPSLETGIVLISPSYRGRTDGHTLAATVRAEGALVTRAEAAAGEDLLITIDEPRPWSPEDPFLYDIELELREGVRIIDTVSSYFVMRSVSICPDADGRPRICLNGEPYFMYGLLDQGYWPDGLYTAPTDEALRHDLEVTKRLGFNTVRKHVKVEPARWYHHCDRMGLLVWQDMPSGGEHIGPDDPDLERGGDPALQFRSELTAMIESLRHHPSVVIWVPFNEGWGQFQTAEITDLVEGLDPSRLVISASGWADRGTGDIADVHVYPGPSAPMAEHQRAGVLGEFGGLGLPIAGHTWQDESNWGYLSFNTIENLREAYRRLTNDLRMLRATTNLSGAIYTQTTDVEIEVNGVMTYDRVVIKLDDPRLIVANEQVRADPPRIRTLSPSALTGEAEWKYTTEEPEITWTNANFDDSGWQEGMGGFGTEGTPGAIVRTEWNTPEIWLRRRFTVPPDVDLTKLALLVHHDEDTVIMINDGPVATFDGFRTGYGLFPLGPRGASVISHGPNMLTVRCRQTEGGQFIDVGVVELEDTKPEE